MLHIVRKNETVLDLAKIYGEEESRIAAANGLDENGRLCENTGVWIPSDKFIEFTSGETAPSTDSVEFPSFPTAKNTRLKTEYAPLKFDVGAVFKIRQNDSPFVPVDLYARDLNKLFLDVYEVNNANLNLPNDYPAINACDVNNTKACFAVSQISDFTKEDILQQLIYDLSFKSYKEALLIISSESEANSAETLMKELKAEDFNVNIAAPMELLLGIDCSGYKTVYYKTEHNIFDFESFAANIDKLVSVFGESKTGVFYIPRGADIDKSTREINVIDCNESSALIKENNISKISFDDRTQLCFTSYERENAAHNILFEDMRSFYAKANYLIDKNINNILFSGLSYATTNYYGLLKCLEHFTYNKAKV